MCAQVEGELVSRKRLEELAPEQFSSILILADEMATFGAGSSSDGAADSDSRNLATLLLLRDLQTKRMGPQPLQRKSRSSEMRIRPSEFYRFCGGESTAVLGTMIPQPFEVAILLHL